MSLSISRRSMLAGFLSTLAAPAMVKADMLMPIKVWRYGPRPVVLADGILLCNGAEVERSAYPELFNLMGTRYGEGDGKHTFLIPQVPARGFKESIPPMGIVASGDVPIAFGRVGQGFDLGSNCINAEILSSVENGAKPIEWTPKAKMLMQESGRSLEYIKPDLSEFDIKKAEVICDGIIRDGGYTRRDAWAVAYYLERRASSSLIRSQIEDIADRRLTENGYPKLPELKIEDGILRIRDTDYMACDKEWIERQSESSIG